MQMLHPGGGPPRDLHAAYRSRSGALRALGVALGIAAIFASVDAKAAPPGFAVQQIGFGWSEAVGIVFTADGRGFVWERPGRIYALTPSGQRSSQPVLDISDEVGAWRDFGLLGVALHPNFLSNGFVYLFYVVDRHHLIYSGTPQYDPNSNWAWEAAMGRITRYRLRIEDDFQSTDYGSRLVLLGETLGSGPPILHQSHGVGSLVFGSDGTLLATAGDGASYASIDVGSAIETYYTQGLADGIIRPEENVGAFRSQMVDSYSGKLLRIDPDTGDGLPSNPFFDPANPRSPRSRTFALGLRNPYRLAHRPNTGSHDRADGDPGVFYIGDVGFSSWEDLQILTRGGQNFGWPIFEGIDPNTSYQTAGTQNRDAPNPLYGVDVPGVGVCTQQYFRFSDLLQQETADPNPPFPNPCDPSQEIPDTWNDGSETHSYFKFVHTRPAIDYFHGSGPSRWTGYDTSGNPVTVDIGQGIPGGKTVPGPQFGGNASTGGAWLPSDVYGPEYENTYFHGDYASQWIRNLVFDANDELLEVKDFHSGAGGVVNLSVHPLTGELYYIAWTSTLYRIRYVGVGNQPPVAVPQLDVQYGPEPLTVAFTGDQSTDPNNDPLTYAWDFGDGSPISTAANPSHTFAPGTGNPTGYTVTLTVTDDSLAASLPATLTVSVNNTPPSVTITSPIDGALYSPTGQGESYPMTAVITDAEQASGFQCTWLRALYHNNHNHPEPPVEECVTSEQFVITAVGCDGNTYFHRVTLDVTDTAGLTTTVKADMYPDCPNIPPEARDDAASVAMGYAVAIDVLANDVDPDFDPLDPASVTVISPPASGATSVDPVTGVITYTHDGSTAASDSFTYVVADLDPDDPLTSLEGTVTISAFNTAPTVSITAPLDLSTFSPFDAIPLAAVGDDAEDGASVGYAWSIDRVHNDQLVQGVHVDTGATPPDFVVPDAGLPGDRISYWVHVTATDVVGATATDSALIVPLVPPAGNGAPVASFTATATQPTIGFAVEFDAAASFDPDGDYLFYRWDFGDGTTAEGPLVQHVFTASGTPTVVLTVIDAAGVSNASALPVTVLAPGLEGSYYNNIDLTDDANNPALVRSDPKLDFNWGTGSPDPLIQSNAFSVRWRGRIEPLYSETYTIYTTGDDGIRAWVDGQQITDGWVDQGPTEYSGTIALTAGVKHDIVVEYYENGGGAVAQLRWSSPSQPKQIVPASQLFPPIPSNAPPFAVDDVDGTLTTVPLDIDVLANDTDDRDEIDPTTVVATDGILGTTSVDPATGVVTYTPNGTAGTDFFTYTVDDLQGLTSNVATVSVSVADASAIFITSPLEGESVAGPDVTILYTLEGDPSLYDHLHWTVDGGPVVMDYTRDGSYLVEDLAPGPHTVQVDLADGMHASLGFPNSQATVGFTVLPYTSPVARPDVATVLDSASVPIDVLANDTDDVAIDPSTVQVVTPPAVGSVAVDPVTGVVTYTHDGSPGSPVTFGYTVDDFGGASSAETTVTVWVTDGDLTLDALTGNLAADEGAAFAFSATATSGTPGNVLTFSWDLDGDGVYDDLVQSPGPGTQTSGGSASLPEDGVYTLGVRVDDGAGRLFVGSFVVTVQNVAPTLDVLTGDLTVTTFESFAYSATASDGGAFDMLTFEWDLDDDGLYEQSQATGPSPQTTGATHSFPSVGTNAIHVRVTDDDGGTVTGSFTVTVETSPPTIDSIGTAVTIDEGGTYAFAATASDVDAADVLTFEWDLDGDGQYDDRTDVTGTGSQASSGSASLPEDGVYAVGLRVTDGVGGATTGSFDVTVANVAPALAAGFAERRALSFDNAAQAETLTDFPVLVRLDATRIDYAAMQPGGIDLHFRDSAGVPLAHEIERWDPAGTSIVWVEVPAIAAGSTSDFVWMYYGSSQIPQSTEDPAGVWSNGYAAVWHLHDDLLDSTANANDGANNGSTDVPGVLGDGQSFDGTAWIDVVSSPSLEITGALSLEAWVRIADPALDATMAVLSKKDFGNGAPGYDVEIAPLADSVTARSSGADVASAAGAALDASWHHVASTVSGTTGAVYVDGVDVTTDATLSALVADGRALYLGRRSSSRDYYEGELDEVRVSNVQRSAAWIAAQYLSMTDAFVTYGAPEPVDPFASGIAVDEGQSFPISADATDVGMLDALTFDWDLDGDGQFDDFTEALGTTPQTSTGTASMQDDGAFVLGVRVSDDDGGASTKTVDVTAANVAPTLDALTADLTAGEGEAFAHVAMASDPGALDLLTFEWDLDGDAAYDDWIDAPGTASQTSSGTAAIATEGVYDLGVRVSDGDGGVATGGFRVTVVNAAPAIDAFTGDVTIAEGGSVQVAVTATDPGPTDVLTFDWELDGDGLYDDLSEQLGAGTQSSTTTLAYEDDASQPISVRVSDGEGGQTFANMTVTAQNVPPTLNFLTADVAWDVTSVAPLRLDAVATDPSMADVLTFHWELDGDGLFDDLTVTAGKFVASSSVFPDLPPGEYQLGVRVVDDDGGEAVGTLTVTMYVPGPTESLPAISPLGRVALGLLLIVAAGLLGFRRRRVR